MLPKGIQFTFTAELWRYNGPGGWHFVSLPMAIAQEIRVNLQSEEEGWGRLKAIAKIGKTEWKTAIWFDTKLKTYLLPLNAQVRKQENLVSGKSTTINIWV